MAKRFYRITFIFIFLFTSGLLARETVSVTGKEWINFSDTVKTLYLKGFLKGLKLSRTILEKSINDERKINFDFIMPTYIFVTLKKIEKYEFNRICPLDEMVRRIDLIYAEELNLDISVDIVILSIVERKLGNPEKADRILIEARKSLIKEE
ncbi:MAG: hypothetical protein DRP91_03070 [Candidatus Neomarinimicrobiota bacterium]|nr:hypothetical protein [Candidatus Neomarinimicrobiota bacterium]RKY49909.1 MAG: hypothetical protein DRP91_03070 [Candidatus Neomarinimicrobiota bacterium]